MQTPDLTSEYEIRGHIIDVGWFDVLKKDDIPDLQWHQVYIIGDYLSKVPIVTYLHSQDNLPGGGVEPGESLEQAMSREVAEELNMKVTDWEPLGYQTCIHRDTGEISNQFRAYAKLVKIGDFTSDPGGSVSGHKLIELDDLNNYIKYGAVGERLLAGSRRYFTK